MLLLVYALLLILRWFVDLLESLGRSVPRTGVVALIFEFVYTVTDPPLKLMRRLLPPLRVGGASIDLGYMVLLLVIFVLRRYAQTL